MKIRFRFRKEGRLKYIGHLDVLNIWNRAVKSAKLPIEYSKGYNPHMLMSFAAPLPLGLTSVSEYVDVDFDDGADIYSLKERINRRFPEGLEIDGVYSLIPPFSRVAAVVERAEYRIWAPFLASDEQISGFMSQERVELLKKTKRKNEITDILPDIFNVRIEGRDILAELSCGSAKNLKPTLFMEAFSGFCGENPPPYKIRIERREILGRKNDGEEIKPLSLLV